jgi:hypothetical protein
LVYYNHVLSICLFISSLQSVSLCDRLRGELVDTMDFNLFLLTTTSTTNAHIPSFEYHPRLAMAIDSEDRC